MYISRDVIFDENVFPFSQLPSNSTPPNSSIIPLSPDQFENAAYTPLLLAKHGAGTHRGAQLEFLDESATGRDVDRTAPPDTTLHGTVLHPHAGQPASDASDGFVTPPRVRACGPRADSPTTASTTSDMPHGATASAASDHPSSMQPPDTSTPALVPVQGGVTT